MSVTADQAAAKDRLSLSPGLDPPAQLATIHEVSRIISSAADLGEMSQAIARLLAETLQVQAGILLLDPRAGRKPVATYRSGPDGTPNGPELPLAGNPLREQAIASRRPLAIGDVRHDAVAESIREGLQECRIESLLLVPLVARGQVVGLVELDAVGGPRPFSPQEVELAQTAANHLAVTMETWSLRQGLEQASRVKPEFIDFVAHELKQPMTSIQGYAKMLMMGIGGELDDRQRQFVEIIASSADRMGKLVNDLLEVSRLETGRTRLKAEPVNLRDVVEETIASARPEIEARHHRLEVDVADDLPPVLGERKRLVQILANLVSNACRYTPEGGAIRIAVEQGDHPGAPPDHLCVSVSDTGIGMAPHEVAQLEENFFRAAHELVRQQPGSGLGVSISRGLVQLHGGEFRVESEPGRGSTFCFTVPIANVNST